MLNNFFVLVLLPFATFVGCRARPKETKPIADQKPISLEISQSTGLADLKKVRILSSTPVDFLDKGRNRMVLAVPIQITVKCEDPTGRSQRLSESRADIVQSESKKDYRLRMQYILDLLNHIDEVCR